MTQNYLYSRMYADQKINSKRRDHKPPNYSKDEFINWLSENNFDELYINFKNSNFSRYTKPSVDRLENNEGYYFDNMRLVTWGENKAKEHLHIKTPEVGVEQYINDIFVACYDSMMEAERKTGVCSGNISHCCNGKYKSSGGFIWKYKEK